MNKKFQYKTTISCLPVYIYIILITHFVAYVVHFHLRQNAEDVRYVFTVDNGTLLRARVRARKRDEYMRRKRREGWKKTRKNLYNIYCHLNERVLRELLRTKITILFVIKIKLYILLVPPSTMNLIIYTFADCFRRVTVIEVMLIDLKNFIALRICTIQYLEWFNKKIRNWYRKEWIHN